MSKPAKELFLTAVEMDDPAARAAFLDEACGGDADLRRRVEALLRAQADPDSFLDHAAVAGPEVNSSDGTQTENDSAPSGDVKEVLSGETVAEQTTPSDESLSFLAPPQRQGSLGRLDHYEILEVLGKGAFGTVFKAFDEKLHRVVAVKVLAAAYANNGAARKRFIREARTAAAIKNEHVVGIYDVEDQTEPPYLAMEMIDGMSLQQKLDKHGPLGIKEILRIGVQMAEGLAAAHKQGLVHRDIKPSNILLENGVERVKITDFGLARAVDDASVTQSGTVAGTPMYMSPEQAEGLQIDHRSDLFSLGTVLYAMCTGHPPFRASGTHAVLKRVIDAAPRAIREINSEIPDWLCDLIAKLHAKKPEDRFQTAKEVAELLGQHLADLQAGRAGSASERASVAAAESSRPPTGARTSGPFGAASEIQPRKRKRLHRVVLSTVIALGLGFVIWWFGPGWYYYLCNQGLLEFEVEDLWGGTVILHRERDNERLIIPLPSRPVRLEPGDYRVTSVTLHNLPFGEAAWSHDKVTIARGGRHVISIEWRTPVEKAQPAALENKPGWIQLFNGEDLTGWRADEPEKWRVQDRNLIGEARAFLVTRQLYQDFHCRIEAKINGAGVGSVSFRSLPGVHGDVRIGAKNAQAQTGSLFLFTGTKAEVRTAWPTASAPSDAWFTLEILVRGKRVEVKVNGVTTADQTIPELPNHGGINLNAYEPGTVLHVRKVEIKELPPEESGWVSLLSSKDLSGWKMHPKRPGDWRMDKGVLVGNGATPAILVSERGALGPVPVRLEIMVNEGGEAGLYFAASGTAVTEPELSAGIRLKGTRQVPGTAVAVADGAEVTVACEPGRWYTLQTKALGSLGNEMSWQWLDRDGNECSVGVARPPRGHFFLRTLKPGTVVSVRKIENKELPPEEPGWAQLFNGKDISAWNMKASPLWKFENGILSSKGGDLLPVRERFQNCRIKIEARYFGGEAYVRLGPQGIQEPGGKLRFVHHLIHLHNQLGDAQTGSITVDAGKKVDVAKAVEERTRPGEWFTLELLYQDKHVQTWVNDKSAADFTYPDAGKYIEGTVLSLGVVGQGGELEIRKVEVKELPPAASPPPAVAPFDAKTAKEHQDAWAKHLGVPVEITNSIGMKLRLIPPGEFLMGSTARDIEKLLADAKEAEKFFINAEGPQRSVRISSPFYMGTFEITQAEYRRVMGVNPSDFSQSGKAGGKIGEIDTEKAGFPVENVSWHDAVAFCQKLSDLPKERDAGRIYRLATEAQWEYACRAGSVTPFHTGDMLTEAAANFNLSLSRPTQVGAYPANAFGLHDMHGNVFEWCQDSFAPDYRNLPSLDPQGPEAGDNRVVRGGNYAYRDRYCRSAARDRFQPTTKRGGIGFRVVMVGDWKAKLAVSGPLDDR